MKEKNLVFSPGAAPTGGPTVLELVVKAPLVSREEVALQDGCPFCNAPLPSVSNRGQIAILKGGCKHALLEAFDPREESFMEALSSPRSWQGDDDHPWPWSGGWPSTELFFEFFDGRWYVARHEKEDPRAKRIMRAYSQVRNGLHRPLRSGEYASLLGWRGEEALRPIEEALKALDEKGL